MRDAHFDNPLHSIERWTGKYFRRASMWEVGVYLRVPHEGELKPCGRLQSQLAVWCKIEKEKDEVDVQGHVEATLGDHAAHVDRAQADADNLYRVPMEGPNVLGHGMEGNGESENQYEPDS